jgi:predicted RNase H-like HicB family nuclease
MPMRPVLEKTPAGYVARVDGLPGAHTQGDTLDEARENLGGAVKLVLETRRIIGAMQASGSWPPAWMSDPPRDRSDYDADPHRPLIRHPFILDLDHFPGSP